MCKTCFNGNWETAREAAHWAVASLQHTPYEIHEAEWY